MEKDNRDKTPIISHPVFYYTERMQFEVQNASSTFQRAMDAALSAVLWQFVLSYVDNTVVLPRFSAEPIDHANNER